jgi:hypothetical protein
VHAASGVIVTMATELATFVKLAVITPATVPAVKFNQPFIPLVQRLEEVTRKAALVKVELVVVTVKLTVHDALEFNIVGELATLIDVVG